MSHSEIYLQFRRSVLSFVLWRILMVESVLLKKLSPPSDAKDDVGQSPMKDGGTAEGDLEQLDRNPIRSINLFACQRADGFCH